MTDPSTVFVATHDLAGHTRGRAVPASSHDDVLRKGVGWVPADLALTAFGEIASNMFGSVGDLRLLPVVETGINLPAGEGEPVTRLYLAEQTGLDGTIWAGCPRGFARTALDELQKQNITAVVSFEHEFMLTDLAASAPFSLRRFLDAEPFGSRLLGTLSALGLQPENWLPEYGEQQFEITLEPTAALQAADRAIMVKEVVRDLAIRHGHRASFAPLLDPAGSGNGVHVHLSLTDAHTGAPLLHDPARPGRLSTLGHRFAAGVLRHAQAILAFTAPSPSSFLRLTPHRWSAGGVFLAERNREALLRICPTSTIGGGDPARQLNLEFRAVDATANPWLVLGCIVRAGLAGLMHDYPEPRVWPESANIDPRDVPHLPGSLDEALLELEKDETVTSWFSPELLRTHIAVKRAELDAVGSLDQHALCERIADVY